MKRRPKEPHETWISGRSHLSENIIFGKALSLSSGLPSLPKVVLNFRIGRNIFTHHKSIQGNGRTHTMQSNSATTKRRGGRNRVSLYLLLGAGIGAAVALLAAPLKGSELRRLIAKKAKEKDPKLPSSDRPRKISSMAGNGVTGRPAKITVTKMPLIAERNVQRREARAASRCDMRISEQRYRIAHSGRRPSNIL